VDDSGLMDSYVNEGRIDKALALTVFLEIAKVVGPDENIVITSNPKAFYTRHDDHQN
jgi:pentatricopeptide repeat protein